MVFAKQALGEIAAPGEDDHTDARNQRMNDRFMRSTVMYLQGNIGQAAEDNKVERNFQNARERKSYHHTLSVMSRP